MEVRVLTFEIQLREALNELVRKINSKLNVQMIMTTGGEFGDFDLFELVRCKRKAGCYIFSTSRVSMDRTMAWSFWQESTGSAWMISDLHGIHQVCMSQPSLATPSKFWF